MGVALSTGMVSFEGKGDVRFEDDHPRLSVVGPNGARADFLVVADEVRIGRSGTSDVILADATASYAHAMLRRSGGAYEVLDLQSRNGVYVNGERVDSACVLHDGDEVLIGRTEVKFSWPAEAATERDEADDFDDDVATAKSGRKVRAAWIAFASRIIAHTLGAAAMIILGLLIAGGMPAACGLANAARSDGSTLSEGRPDSTTAPPVPAPDLLDPSS